MRRDTINGGDIAKRIMAGGLNGCGLRPVHRRGGGGGIEEMSFFPFTGEYTGLAFSIRSWNIALR